MSEIRKAALSLYKPPFKYVHGYIYDSGNQMVADDGGSEHSVENAVISRIRGWGRISYMQDAEALQDEMGQIVVDALNAYYKSLENVNA